MSDIKDTAREAVKNFTALLPSINGYVRALTGNSTMTVEAVPSGTRTDGKKIYIQPPARLGSRIPHDRSLCDKRMEGRQQCEACAIREEILSSIYHEIAHNVAGSFDDIDAKAVRTAQAEALKTFKLDDKQKAKIVRWAPLDGESYKTLGGIISPWLPSILNAIEDSRVDNAMFAARRGTKAMNNAKLTSILTKGNDMPDGRVVLWNQQPVNAQAILSLYTTGVGYAVKGYLSDAISPVLDDPELNRIARSSADLQTVHDSLQCSMLALKRLHELGYCDPPLDEEQDSEDSEEPSDDSDSTSGDDSSEDQAESSPEGDSEPENDREGSSSDSSSHSDRSEDQPADNSSSESDSSNQEEAPDGDSSAHRDDNEAGQSESDKESETDDGSDTFADGGVESESEAEAKCGAEASDGDETDGHEADELDDSSDGDGGSDSQESEEFNNPDGERGSEGSSGSDEQPADESGASDRTDTASDGGSDELREGSSERFSDGDNSNPMEELEFGTPEDAQKLLDEITGHDENSDPADNEEPLTSGQLAKYEDAVEVALNQAAYFDTESKNVEGVRIFRHGDVLPDKNGKDLCIGFRLKGDPNRNLLVGDNKDLWPEESVMGPALLELRNVLADNKRSSMERHLRSGKINQRVLGRRAWAGDDRLFQKKRIPGKKSYSVVIGIDISGSTLGNPLALAKKAALAQAELCARMGIDFAVYAHTAWFKDHPESMFYKDSGFYLDVYVLKDFDEPWSTKQKAAFEDLASSAENLDGHGVEFYRKAVERRSSTDKIILYYTDGEMPATNYAEELKLLKDEIITCKRKSIILIGVGIETDSPKKHGLDTVRVDKVEDVRKVVQHLKTALLHAG